MGRPEVKLWEALLQLQQLHTAQSSGQGLITAALEENRILPGVRTQLPTPQAPQWAAMCGPEQGTKVLSPLHSQHSDSALLLAHAHLHAQRLTQPSPAEGPPSPTTLGRKDSQPKVQTLLPHPLSPP